MGGRCFVVTGYGGFASMGARGRMIWSRVWWCWREVPWEVEGSHEPEVYRFWDAVASGVVIGEALKMVGEMWKREGRSS